MSINPFLRANWHDDNQKNQDYEHMNQLFKCHSLQEKTH